MNKNFENKRLESVLCSLHEVEKFLCVVNKVCKVNNLKNAVQCMMKFQKK